MTTAQVCLAAARQHGAAARQTVQCRRAAPPPPPRYGECAHPRRRWPQPLAESLSPAMRWRCAPERRGRRGRTLNECRRVLQWAHQRVGGAIAAITGPHLVLLGLEVAELEKYGGLLRQLVDGRLDVDGVLEEDVTEIGAAAGRLLRRAKQAPGGKRTEPGGGRRVS